MKLRRAILGLGLCVGLILPFFARHAAAVEVVTARITCPLTTYVKLDWKDKIGTNPTFHVTTGTHEFYPKFDKMMRHNQKIICLYKSARGEVDGQYLYTVQRAIQTCTQVRLNVMDCVVKK
jgi:hypothetical protein